ncbi:MAG TPA: hypothetical protein VHE99_01700 [Gammaproteobacteria bacterium]|nr:hypothetical protein [Gammaproteobacteria bacterium]
MKKSIMVVTAITALASLIWSSACLAVTLSPINKSEFEKSIINKTLTSIPTDNLNGRTINNTFSFYLDNQGHAWGKMSVKPKDEPQTDQGTYSVDKDGTFHLTWQHWDYAKTLCGHLFETQNAYISVDCDNVFHTVFMKENILSGNHL